MKVLFYSIKIATNQNNRIYLPSHVGDYEKFEDTKGVFSSRKSKKGRQYNGQQTKGQTIICKTLRRKLQIKQNEFHYKPGVT